MKRLVSTATAGWLAAAAAVAALAVAPAVVHADATDPTGAVGGKQNPASKLLKLHIQGRSADAPLSTAIVSIDGAMVAQKTLCDADHPGCQPGSTSVGAADIDVDITGYTEGQHQLTVQVTDTAGKVGTITDELFEVDNIPPVYSDRADLTIGSAVPGQQGSGGSQGGVEGAQADSCPSPKLSVLLAQKPLRIKHRVPVLIRNQKYRFSGRLTCLINHRRRSAAKHTVIHLHIVKQGKVVWKTRFGVGSGGKFAIRLKSPTKRTLDFTYISANHKVTHVKIKLTVVRKPRAGH